MGSRRFYRLVRDTVPTADDFRSLIESGHPPYDDPGLQRRAEEVSVWDSMAGAMRVARKKRRLSYIAILEIPETIALSRGRRGHWGIPKNLSPEQIIGWVVEVIDVPSVVRDQR